jgi:hypothetical protein
MLVFISKFKGGNKMGIFSYVFGNSAETNAVEDQSYCATKVSDASEYNLGGDVALLGHPDAGRVPPENYRPFELR